MKNKLFIEAKTNTPNYVFALLGTILASIEFMSIFTSHRIITVIILGAFLGGTIAFLCKIFDKSIQFQLILLIILFFMLSAPASYYASSGIFPSLSSLEDVATTVVSGWSKVVTSQLPLSTQSNLLVLPYLLATMGSFFSFVLVSKTTRSVLCILPSGVILVLGILLGTSSPVSDLTRAIPLFTVEVYWMFILRRKMGPEVIGERTNLSLIGITLMVVASLGISYFLVPSELPNSERVVLRNYVKPPFNPSAYPSPLNGYRNYVVENKNTTLFTMDGVHRDDEIRLATMDIYNGVVWSVGQGSSGSGTYVYPGSPISSPSCPSNAGCRQEVINVKDDAYGDVWLPSIGNILNVSFSGPRAKLLTSSLQYCSATQSVVEPVLILPGDSYQMRSLVPISPSRSAIMNDSVNNLKTPLPTNVPDVVKTRANTLSAGAETDFEKLELMSTKLKEDGAYSDGQQNEPVSIAGSGAYRMAEFFQGQPVGDAEQYASALALMADSLGLHARVVIGARAPASGSFQVKGSDITAWVEVNFEGVGWYQFFPTPLTSAKKNPNPPPTQSQAENNPATGNNLNSNSNSAGVSQNAKSNSANVKKKILARGGLLGILIVGGEISLPLWIVLGAMLFIMMLKSQRARRRANSGTRADQIAGAWEEVKDNATDFGLKLSPNKTRFGHALELGQEFEPIAKFADMGVFGPDELAQDEVRQFWNQVENAISDFKKRFKLSKQFKAKISVASLRGGLSNARKDKRRDA